MTRKLNKLKLRETKSTKRWTTLGPSTTNNLTLIRTNKTYSDTSSMFRTKLTRRQSVRNRTKEGKNKKLKDRPNKKNNSSKDKNADNNAKNNKNKENNVMKKENLNSKPKGKPLSTEIPIGNPLNFASS